MYNNNWLLSESHTSEGSNFEDPETTQQSFVNNHSGASSVLPPNDSGCDGHIEKGTIFNNTVWIFTSFFYNINLSNWTHHSNETIKIIIFTMKKVINTERDNEDNENSL